MMQIKRDPTTPGEMLKEEFLIPLKLTEKSLATHIDCEEEVINRLINNKEPISTMLALKLASAFNTTPDFWLNLQRAQLICIEHIKILLANQHFLPLLSTFTKTSLLLNPNKLILNLVKCGKNLLLCKVVDRHSLYCISLQ